ncbi:MAG TPA: hypothetical protein PKB10_06115 [Tepidisphaeraceae bacterium]|nr:hypothetical protein [Tepidisphaeraceae bacterium]
MPHPFDVATSDVRLRGAITEIDPATGRAQSIERIEIEGKSVDPAYDIDDRKQPTGRE